MAAYLKPRRGKKNTAIDQDIILKRGEIFFEVPNTGVGSGQGNLKMGDGVTTYKNLPYYININDIMKDLIHVIEFKEIEVPCQANQIMTVDYNYPIPEGYRIAMGTVLYGGNNYGYIRTVQIRSTQEFSFRVRTEADIDLHLSSVWILIKTSLNIYDRVDAPVNVHI